MPQEQSYEILGAYKLLDVFLKLTRDNHAFVADFDLIVAPEVPSFCTH